MALLRARLQPQLLLLRLPAAWKEVPWSLMAAAAAALLALQHPHKALSAGGTKNCACTVLQRHTAQRHEWHTSKVVTGAAGTSSASSSIKLTCRLMPVVLLCHVCLCRCGAWWLMQLISTSAYWPQCMSVCMPAGAC